MKISTTLVLVLAAGAAAMGSAAFAPLQRVSILDAALAQPRTITALKGVSVRFAPGQPTGLHLHPNPTVGIVTEGTFVFQPQGQPLRTLKVGDAFYEPANVPILRFDNASTTAPARISAFFLQEKSDMPLIKMLDRLTD